MDNARVAQLAPPAEIYERPRTAFVARFIGESNFCEGEVVAVERGGLVVKRADGTLVAARGGEGREVGARVQISVRPERVELTLPDDAPAGHNRLPARVRQVVYRGEMLHVRATLADGAEMVAAMRNEGQLRRPVSWQEGVECAVTFAPDDARVLEPEPT
jgi:ABC-type Fe3+/spermidine/putrescine transport system ATPase subunit